MVEYSGSRDPRFIRIHRRGLLDEAHHRLLAAWAARYTSDPAASQVARAAGHAVATAHMADRELGGALFAIKAVRLAAPLSDAAAAGERECHWRREQLPDAIRELVLSDEERRNKELGSLSRP